MKSKLIELWIFNQSGVPLFHWLSPLFHEEFRPSDPIFTTFLFSAIESITNGEINTIRMKDSTLVIASNCDIIEMFFAARFRSTSQEGKARKTVETIIQKFITKYQQNLKTWDGEVTQFSEFSQIVSDEFIEI